MSVRTKLAVTTTGVLLLLLLALFAGGRPIIISSLRQAELDAAVRTLPLLDKSLLEEENRLKTLAQGWSSPDSPVAGFFCAETPPASAAWGDYLDSMKVDLVAAASPEGRLLAGGFRQWPDADIRPVPAALETHLAPNQPLRSGKPLPSSPALLLVEGIPMIVAVAPAGTGGVVLVGRSLTSPELKEQWSRLLAGLSAKATFGIRTGGTAMPAVSGTAVEGDVARSAGRLTVHPAGRQVLRATLPLQDVQGSPACALVATLPRTFSLQAEWALAGLTGLIATVGLLFVLVLFVLQSRIVLDPLSRLTEGIRSFHDGNPTGRRMAWTRADEFGVVAQEVDRMLEAIERNQAAVVESEQRNRALLTANPDAMAVLDGEGNFLDLHVTEQFAPLFSPEHMIGRRVDQIGLPPEAAARYLDAIARVLKTGDPEHFEYLRPKGAESFWGEARIVRMDRTRVLAIIRDITARKRAEEERTRMHEKMRQVQKLESLGVLASGVAHDFNNLLTIIVGYAELTKASLTENVRAMEMTDNIRDSAKRAAGLAKQMLAYAGQGGYELNRLDLNLLLGDMVPLLRASVSRLASLEFSGDPNLPDIDGDAIQLRQVVMNLAMNSSEAMQDHPGRIHVITRRIRLEKDQLAEYISGDPLVPGEYAEIRVEDSGCGMDAPTLARIFDPFFSTKAVGRGLGLSATLGIVRAHRGGICAHSTPGQGTLFSIVFPAAAPKIAAPPAPPRPPPAPAEDPNRPLVLVVDDEEDICRIATLMLRAAGYRVMAAHDGLDAIARFSQVKEDVQLVLMDVEMPGMNGVETFQTIRRSGSQVPIIVISGYGDTMIRDRFRHLDPAAFLFKPFTSDQLTAVVARTLATRTNA